MCNGYDAWERGGGSEGMRRAMSYGHDLDQEHFHQVETLDWPGSIEISIKRLIYVRLSISWRTQPEVGCGSTLSCHPPYS